MISNHAEGNINFFLLARLRLRQAGSVFFAAKFFYFRKDGLKVYFNGHEHDKTWELNMSTAWDVTSITSTSQSFATSASLPLAMDEDLLAGITFHPDGNRMYTTGNRQDMDVSHEKGKAFVRTPADNPS